MAVLIFGIISRILNSMCEHVLFNNTCTVPNIIASTSFMLIIGLITRTRKNLVCLWWLQLLGSILSCLVYKDYRCRSEYSIASYLNVLNMLHYALIMPQMQTVAEPDYLIYRDVAQGWQSIAMAFATTELFSKLVHIW